MPNQFGLAGANPGKQTKKAPIYTGRWSSGIWTNRSPLRDAATTRQVEKFYGPSGDALMAGSNVEITNRLTLGRRPGNDVFPPLQVGAGLSWNSVDRYYSFRLFNSTQEQIYVMVDQATSLQYFIPGTTTVAPTVWSKSAGAGQSYMQSVGNTLYFADGVDNKKWLQSLVQWQPNMAWNTSTTPFLSTFLIDSNGNIEQLTGTAIPIGYVAANAANAQVQIITNLNLASILTVGQQVTFPNNMTAAFLDGLTVTITVIGTGANANSFYFNLINAGYVQTPEANKTALVYPGDGTPFSGSTPPIWSTTVPSALNNFAGGTTIDGTVLWTNRGNPVENWGIQPPTSMIIPTVQGSLPIWEENTYYSLPGVVIDTNGNLQQVTRAGLTGATIAWNTVLNGMTYDGLPSSGVQWKMIESSGQLNWQANTPYATGSFIIGTGCLFELMTSTAPYIMGGVSAYIYPGDSSQFGVFTEQFPTSLGTSLASTTTLTGFNFTGTPLGSGAALSWDTINNAGATIGETNPFPSFTQDYDMVILATLQVPVAGQYTFVNVHHDGCLMGIGGGAITLSAPPPDDPANHTVSAVMGYPLCGGTNIRYEAGGFATDTFIIDFPTAGTYGIELDYSYWFHSGQELNFTCNGNVIAFGVPTNNGGTSGGTQPVWPAWTTADAPAYPTISEASGRLTWSNVGPIADFHWYASTNYTLPNSTIVDPNSNMEGSYRTGRTGTLEPTFTTTLDGLTTDNPNLIWINTGQSTQPPLGSITTSNGGWIYAVSLVNTLDDTVSNATPVSAATGDFTGAFGVILPPGAGLPPVADIDPQADYVAIWRSTDGQAQPFLIPGPNDFELPITIPLSQYLQFGYTDTTPDVGLNNLIEAPILGENTPPAKGAKNLTYFLNRIFYSVANVVEWTSGPDTPAGNGFNGSAPLNFDEQVSLVKRIVPLTQGALVFTVSDINLITGNGTASSPIESAVPFTTGIGLASYNALDINGSLIGFFTTDHQFVILDPANGVTSAGFPIGDQLRLNNGTPGQSWNPANVYVTWHVNGEDQAWYVADGKNGWYRLMATPAPETGTYTWSPFATIAPGCQAVQSVETAPGVHNLLLGPVTNGKTLARNLDSTTDNGITYPASALIGSAVLAQPGQIAVVDFVTTESVNVGTPLVMGVLIDEAYPYFTGPFDLLKFWVNDPPSLRPSVSILGQRFYLDELGNDAAMCRHLQLQVSWAAEPYQNELLTLTIFGGFLQED